MHSMHGSLTFMKEQMVGQYFLVLIAMANGMTSVTTVTQWNSYLCRVLDGLGLCNNLVVRMEIIGYDFSEV